VNLKFLSDKNIMRLAQSSSWDEERREVLDSIGEELRRGSSVGPGL